ncbi:MAG: insulinase family protein [Planctomycetes bacterium]|nr:insulinase family protein [Planctomycetota bacterium]
MKHRHACATHAGIALSLFLTSFATQGTAAAQSVRATKFVLDNGLQVIFHEDHSLPIATVNLWYYVGSKDEREGRSGFAHLFEHLMFMGTKRVPGSRFDEIMEKGGGANNASTSSDRTNYFSWGPSELLPTLLWLEADRMEDFGKALTQEKLDKQRDVVRNERRQTTEMRPYGVADELQGELFFPPGHGYHKSVIGSHEDLEAATLDDVKNFFATYYVPSNASLVVAGDFDPKSTRELVEKLFGSLPRAPIVPRKEHHDAPLGGTHRWTGYDRVQFPRVTTMFKTVKIFGPLDAELDLVAGILAGSKSSRLYKRLVVDEKLAVQVTAYQWSRFLGGQFHIQVMARPDADLARIEAILTEEVAKLAEQGPTEDELARQRTSTEYGFVTGLESLRDRADRLNAYNFHLGTPDGFATDLDRYREVTVASLQLAVRAFLTTDDKLVQTVLPIEREPAGDRDTMPEVGSADSFTFTPPATFTLANGIRVHHWKRDEMPLVRIAMQIGRGALVDETSKSGRTFLMARMLEEGAGERGAFAFAEALQSIGAELDTRASRETVRVEVQSLASRLDEAAALWKDCIVSPRFEESDWQRVRRLHADNLERRQDDPAQVAREVASIAYFGANHPFGQPVDGRKETVTALTLDDVRMAYRGLVRPELATIYIAGDVDEARARTLLEGLLGSWTTSGDAIAAPAVPPVTASGQRLYIVDRPGAVQTVVRFMMPGPVAKDPERSRYEAINTIVGGSFTSRLNSNIREEHGYAYGAGSGYAMWPQLGCFIASSSVQGKFTGPALREFLKEFTRLRGGDITAEEATKAKSTGKQELVSSLGGLRGLLTMAMSLDADGFDFGELGHRMMALQTIDAAGLNAIASRSVRLDDASILLVGDKDAILPQLEGLGLPAPILLDASGEPVPGH